MRLQVSLASKESKISVKKVAHSGFFFVPTK
jgi:hypothetical protein